MNFNNVILAGNLTRDPEAKTAGSSMVCKFGIAINRKYATASGEKREEVCFVDCEAWGKTAELIVQHFTKGKPIFVTGRLKLDQWEDKDGAKRSALRVSVESFQFIGGKDEGQRSAPPASGASRQSKSVPVGSEDIPF